MLEDQRGERPAADDADAFEWVNAWARQDALTSASGNDPAPATEADNVHVLRAAFAADALRAASALGCRLRGRPAAARHRGRGAGA